MPDWGLALAYWLHMAATVVWIGGLFFQSVMLQPLLDDPSHIQQVGRLLHRLQTRFNPLAWLSLAVLTGTGLIQMSANPNYTGLLQVDSSWAVAILAKHLVIAAMVGVAAYQTWVLQPRLIRFALDGVDAADASQLRRLTRISFALGLAVLLLTALARAA